MQDASFDEPFARIQARDARYHRDAYVFVREGLEYTQKSINKDSRGKGKHISGQQLLLGLRDYALQQFGPMAKTVFEEWGITRCEDFGEIVFNMIDVDWFAKTAKDSRADFAGGYTFDEAFLKPFLPSAKQQAADNQPARPLPSPETKS